MLETPLGVIMVFIDNNPIDYYATLAATDKLCKDIDGRYLIRVNFLPDGKDHKIFCVINDYVSSGEDGIESGECLELKSFYEGGTKLSIGMEGDAGYYPNGEHVSDGYDYDNDYLPNGVSYEIFSTTKTSVYDFGIAWLDNCTDDTDVQTWFGADPTIIPIL